MLGLTKRDVAMIVAGAVITVGAQKVKKQLTAPKPEVRPS